MDTIWSGWYLKKYLYNGVSCCGRLLLSRRLLWLKIIICLFNAPINVKPATGRGGGGVEKVGHRAGIWHFPKNSVKFPTPGKNVRSNITEIPHPGKWFVVKGLQKFKYPYPRDSKIIQMPYPQAKVINQIPALCPAFSHTPHPPHHSPVGFTLIGAQCAIEQKVVFC